MGGFYIEFQGDLAKIRNFGWEFMLKQTILRIVTNTAPGVSNSLSPGFQKHSWGDLFVSVPAGMMGMSGSLYL